MINRIAARLRRLAKRMDPRERESAEVLLAGSISGELLGTEHLAERAQAIASSQEIVVGTPKRRKARLLTRLHGTRQVLQEAHERLTLRAAADRDLGPAGDWLIDNFHVVQEHIQEVLESLPRGYYRELPELASGPLAGSPRIYELAIGLISHSEGRIDLENVDLFVEAFQEVSPLTIGELWAIPAMLRLGLLENVRRMTVRTMQHLDEVEEADAWALRIRDAIDEGGTALETALSEFVSSPPSLGPAFVTRFLQQIRLERGAFPALVPLEEWISDEAMSADEAAVRNMQRLAITQRKMANSITSLRMVERKDWSSFVERQSFTEALLRTDPAGVYAAMTFETRDQYRNVIEKVARRMGLEEEAVAQLAIGLAQTARTEDPGGDPRQHHIGYFLVDEGRDTLEATIGYNPPLRESIHRWALRHPNILFGGGIILGTLVALGLLFLFAPAEARASWLLVLLLALIPANDIAISAMNQLITLLLPPQILPKLELRRGQSIPAELRTAVVVPTLLPNLRAVKRELENLEVQFLANRKENLHFALLTDFVDAPNESVEGDEAIVDAAEKGIRELNTKYGAENEDIFYLFHRPRRWNEKEGVWMGWERKRGKLAEFNRFVLGGAESAFSSIVGELEAIRQVRYVITLDADTVLPPDAAALLVGAIAHPLNRAVYDPEQGRVVRGYGILQPRVSVLLPSAHRSTFASIHSGNPGVDPYTTAVSDVYQDLYGEGSFTGKGIYDLRAFEEATHGRFPENTLLSHDLIEGNFTRAGLVTDINLYDDYPTRYLTYSRRRHRWIRGDWQLLRWLGRTVPGPEGPERNRLSILSRWKILDNLRRSVVEIAQLVFLFAGWTIFPGSPLRWTLLGLAAIASPWVISILLSALRPPLDKSWGPYYLTVFQDAVTSARQLGLTLVFLPHQAWSAADAIVRTLWRLAWSKRHLLEWQSASMAERTLSESPRFLRREMGPPLVLAAGVAIFAFGGELLQLGRDAGAFGELASYRRILELAVATLPLLFIWFLSPSIAHSSGRMAIRKARRLSPSQEETARRYAALHWNFFERFTNADTHWLAPDNFQKDPEPVVAMRTSPTNIGLQLLATVSAFDLRLIDLDEMVRRLELAFETLERMPRYRGHFYNWYDLGDLRVLEPAYVSTVDSGNLAGHLLALAQACLDFIEEPLSSDEQRAGAEVEEGSEASLRERAASSEEARAMVLRLERLVERSRRYVEEMDFGFLYDREQRLFSIGYHVRTHTKDQSFYDLLASEARLASFVAVAKGDVPVEHWFRLGRTLTHAHGATALVSWSGTMFEYLMPALVMRSLPLTLLDQTYEGAVDRQIAYGASRGVPWGISESAYNHRDRNHTYQYRAFGVPDLALKRGLERDLVIAPYASLLAMMMRPNEALANLEKLEELGALGPSGFFDAVDYTRPEPGKPYAVARLYMAHHIGMGLVSLTNMLVNRVWKRRFHADPLVRSARLLLHERMPRRLILGEVQRTPEVDLVQAPEASRLRSRHFDGVQLDQPAVALPGHQPYSVMVNHAGAGYSRHDELAVTRWKSDGTKDATGQFCYLEDLSQGRRWSAGHQPLCTPPDRYRFTLAPEKVSIHRQDGSIETLTEIAVVPKDAAEVRRIKVTNHAEEVREIELTSYGEIVLAPPEMDRAHPAFSNLFVETEWHSWCNALMARRRPRSEDEDPIWCAHIVDPGDAWIGEVSYETDRARFLGRGRSVRDPIAMETPGPLSGTTGAVLDPIFSLRVRLRLAPGQTASVSFTTLVAESRERAFELADRYHDPSSAQRAFDLAWSYKQLELSEFNLSPADITDFQELASHLLYPSPALRASEEERLQNRGSQPLLWANGISGDWPIIVATIESNEGLPTLRQLFAAHHFWRRHGMKVDLVVLIEQPSSYLKELDEQIAAALFASRDPAVLDEPGGIFIRRQDLMGKDELSMLRATARILLHCDGSSIGRILETRLASQAKQLPSSPFEPGGSSFSLDPGGAASSKDLHVPAESSAFAAPLLFQNGLGGINAEGDYQIEVQGDRLPPAPWANVIANPKGGFVVTERGGGFSWAESSYFYRLTPWHNDPITDPASEVIYLRDDESGAIWSATPAPIRSDAPYTVVHGKGVSTFAHVNEGIESRLELGVAEDEPIKIARLHLKNLGERVRRLTLTSYVEWALGAHWEESRHQLRVSFDSKSGAIFAQNHFAPRFAGRVAFSALSEEPVGFTGDRAEFLGRDGSTSSPAGLQRESKDEVEKEGAQEAETSSQKEAALPGWRTLGRATGASLDPCAVLQTRVELAPGASSEITVLLGAAKSEEEARRAIAAYREPTAAREAIANTVGSWEERLSTIRVHTPSPAFDAMLNRWTLYQALACRMWARSALYQSSGAYGFRDQLQDVMAFVYADPAIARSHIIRAASRQFLEGDVQHWWHPESGSGVRTRFSDDRIWLPFVVEHYLRTTGDASILEEEAPFLTMRELEPGEEDAYQEPQVTEERGSIYEHCLRALRRSCTRGAHGLPLIGGGDWNDGMNRIGLGGEGESVWLAWFLIATLRPFAKIAEARGDGEVAAELRAAADGYAAAVETAGWDGAWYRRAYFDDGTPLGTSTATECRIDSIAQSWSVISGAGDPKRQSRAMRSLEEHLVHQEDRMIRLLSPPFDRSELEPGYIKGYLPGVRENGAQYTHAALWAVLATAMLGDGDRAFELFQLINPLTHADTAEGVAKYKVEPYVVAADVYAAKGQLGRGGWTWYTGAASWMYRVGLESILGFKKEGETLRIAPVAPSDWPEFTIEYRFGESLYVIRVVRPGALGDEPAIEVDGTRIEGPAIPLVDDGARREVLIRPSAAG